MPSDIRFSVANRPGAVGKAARILANAGINIMGMGGDIRSGESWGFIHFLVDEPGEAQSTLEAAGYEILDIHEVDLIEAADRPGSLADICERYVQRNENIEVLYFASNNRLVVGTEKMRQAFPGRRVAETRYSETRNTPG
jgi:hypothetical protein